MKKKLFRFLGISSETETPEQQIERLRAEARALRDVNNKASEEIVKIDFKLIKPMDEAKKTTLEARKKELQDIIDSKGYSKKYRDLLERIKALEMQHLGRSDLNNSTFDL